MADKIEMESIGVIRSPFSASSQTPIQAGCGQEFEAAVEVFPEYAEGLDDLEGFDCVWVLWYSHRAKPYLLKVIPYMDDAERGVFATRAPSRPNSIGLSCVKLLRREGSKLIIQGVDMIDGTPVLDLKPYLPSVDARSDCERDGWVSKRKMEKWADNRFTRD